VPLKFNLSETRSRFAVDRHRYTGAEVVPYPRAIIPADLLTHVLGYRPPRRRGLARWMPPTRGTTTSARTASSASSEDELHGISGLEKVETNVRGGPWKVLERDPRCTATTSSLSLDVQIQQAAWTPRRPRGAVVAIDPSDGSVLALVSKPAFDPNLFVQGISQADYQAILAAPGRPLFNRALLGGYEPGSTIKPFLGLAGLESGVIGKDDRVFSNGRFFLPGLEKPFRDWRKGGHGW
jgi:penicillin-binding protein 2